jgi:hypothetical protein
LKSDWQAVKDLSLNMVHRKTVQIMETLLKFSKERELAKLLQHLHACRILVVDSKILENPRL